MQARTLGIRRTHRVLAAIVLAGWALGCRSDPYRDAYLEILNAEKRALEDRLYEVEYNYERALAELKASRESAEGGRKPSSRTPPGRTTRPPAEREGDEPFEVPELPKIELPPGVEAGKRQRPGSVPTVLQPDGSGPASPSANTLPKTTPSAPRAAGSPIATPAAMVRTTPRRLGENELAAAIVSALDQRVETIHLNPRRTGGADFNGESGDDGITVLIEPRNRSGMFVPEPARISVVLLDPAKTGEDARVARWDLEPDAAGECLQTDGLDRGLLLHLPWQGVIPDRKRLHLFVRYLTADGRKLETDREIEVATPDLIARRWTPRPILTAGEVSDADVSLSWFPKDAAGPSAVADAAAERADGPVGRAAQAGAKPPAILRPAPAKPIVPQETGSKKTGSGQRTTDSSSAPAGRFWKPDR